MDAAAVSFITITFKISKIAFAIDQQSGLSIATGNVAGRKEQSGSGFSLLINFLNSLTAWAFRKVEPQSMAMRLSRFGVRKQVIVVFLGKPFTGGMDFSNDRVMTQRSRIHGRASISSKGVTNSGSLYPLAAHRPRITGSCAGLAMWVQFHVKSTSI